MPTLTFYHVAASKRARAQHTLFKIPPATLSPIYLRNRIKIPAAIALYNSMKK